MFKLFDNILGLLQYYINTEELKEDIQTIKDDLHLLADEIIDFSNNIDILKSQLTPDWSTTITDLNKYFIPLYSILNTSTTIANAGEYRTTFVCY